MNKTIYVRDEALWTEVVEYAEVNGLSVSATIELALSRLLKPTDAEVKLKQVEAILKG